MNYNVNVVTFSVVRESGAPSSKTVQKPEHAARLARALILDDGREHFGIFMLNCKNHLLGYHEVSVGTTTASICSPREVFGAALRVLGCVAIVLTHNHPSGDVTPSEEDVDLTQRLVAAGKILDLYVYDHVIISHASRAFASLAQKGLL